MAKRLTDIAIRNLKPEPVRREVPDGNGLYVVVQPSGKKGFAVRYRHHGIPRKLTLPPGLTLAAARKLSADAAYKVAQGIDPADERKARTEKAERAKADTLRSIAETYLARDGKKLRSGEQRKRIFERLIYPVLGGGQPIGDIRRKDVVRMLDHIEDKHGARMADYALACLRKLFNWHAVRDDEFTSPIVRGMARQNAKEHERSRTLDDDELRRVWITAENQGGAFADFVRFLLLTSARRNEGAQMQWSELDGLDWVLPASRNKVKVDLVRPLSGAALSILNNRPRFADSDFVFTHDGSHALGGFFREKNRFDAACGVTGWTLHDLRRTARSLMSRAGVSPDHAERCLGHVIRGVRGTYDRHEFHAEKKRAFEALAALIARLVSGMPADVVPITARR